MIGGGGVEGESERLLRYCGAVLMAAGGHSINRNLAVNK